MMMVMVLFFSLGQNRSSDSNSLVIVLIISKVDSTFLILTMRIEYIIEEGNTRA